ncbi:MAG: TGS domain-containing protein, partial [Massilibacteroides sp.]|nr:TGS domain-containing protein [Massilibacteroides sp.]
KETDTNLKALFERFAVPVDKKLQNMGLTYEMHARVKSAYSIWYKMENKGVSFDDIYDIYAVRIIFENQPGIDEKTQCWEIYSAITDIYRIRPDRIRDWVSRPKANGYQALHLTVMGPDGQWMEIQIRSQRMDDIAEKGFAAHWKYKEHNVEEDTELDKWLHTITEILENPDPNALDFLDTIKLNLFSAEIFVFTPKGDIKTLPQGATALDFAYALHTNIGNKCIGAKVNHRLVPLSHPLTSGDQVEILTSRSQEPQPEWMGFVTTAKARAKVDYALKRVRRETARAGEQKVIAAFKQADIEQNTSLFDKVALYYGFPKRDDLFCSVEKGETILPENIKKILKEKTDNRFLKYLKQALSVGKTSSSDTPEEVGETKEKLQFDKKRPYILREEAFNRNYVIADCCKPIPGDDALGFINDDGNVVVHKRSCPISMRLKSSFGERILSTEWSSHQTASFEATLEIKGIDSLGVLSKISKIISEDFNVNIQRLLIEAKDGMFEGKIKMKVHDVEDIQKICIALSKLKNIKSVGRVAE